MTWESKLNYVRGVLIHLMVIAPNMKAEIRQCLDYMSEAEHEIQEILPEK
jgi:hypothetical protein